MTNLAPVLQNYVVDTLVISDSTDVPAILDAVNAQIIDVLMLKYKYNQSRVAIEMGVSRGTLRKMTKRLHGDKYLCKNK